MSDEETVYPKPIIKVFVSSELDVMTRTAVQATVSTVTTVPITYIEVTDQHNFALGLNEVIVTKLEGEFSGLEVSMISSYLAKIPKKIIMRNAR